MLAASVACEPMNERDIVMLEKGASDLDLERPESRTTRHILRDELFIHFENVFLPGGVKGGGPMH